MAYQDESGNNNKINEAIINIDPLQGKAAFDMAGVKPSDMKFAAIYDSFTITVLMQLEDLGFCKKGEGGRFVADGNLISGVGTTNAGNPLRVDVALVDEASMVDLALMAHLVAALPADAPVGV